MINDSLTLKEFIETTLVDVCEAIENARTEYSYIAPKIDNNAQDSKPTLIEFDIAVTVADKYEEKAGESGKVKAGLNISVVKMEAGIGSEGAKSNESNFSQVSRIKFNVPVFFRFDEEASIKRKQEIEESHQKIQQHNQNRSSRRRI